MYIDTHIPSLNDRLLCRDAQTLRSPDVQATVVKEEHVTEGHASDQLIWPLALRLGIYISFYRLYMKNHSTLLYSTLLYSTILYYTILYYTILYYTILYYTILYYTILYYTILYYTIRYYTIRYYTILYYTIRYDTIRYYTILYYTILYYPLLYSTILYSTILSYPILYSTTLYYTILSSSPCRHALLPVPDVSASCLKCTALVPGKMANSATSRPPGEPGSCMKPMCCNKARHTFS